MFFKFFLIASILATKAATLAQYLQPVALDTLGSECALILPGGARSSVYDHTLSLFRGASLNSVHDTSKTCITYDSINAAYLDARKRIHVSLPKGEWATEDIATVGELLLDISIQLARTYGLSYEDIENGLPQIDTSKTLIREVCPPFFSGVECRPGKYRRFDGLCNNLEHPTWGATMTPFQRLIGPLYADGINAPRVSVTGHDLPLSRVVSRTMHPDEGFHDHAGTVMVIAWGQFMDHDFTLTGTPLDPVNRNDPEECCKRPLHLKHPYCNEIRVPDDDYFYRLFDVKCIDFVRAFPSPRAGCKLGSRAPFNTLTGVIDGNTVYGVKESFARKLRMGEGGLLRMNPVFQEYGLKDLLPLKLDVPDEGCTRPNKSMFCFEAGEIRVNEQLVLACMHTLMAREHNRLARGLAEINPHWDDETLFQEARRINIAIIQHITYNEFLPILLGKEVMEKFGLVLQKDGYWDGYDPKVNPGILDSFAAAAFRFGHSLLPTAVERWSKAHKFIASKRLSDLIRRPYDLYRAGVFDEYLMGLMNQVAQAMDDSITQEVTNHLFKKEGNRFGHDLVAFNMQRGREFGLPGYMEFRKFCGLSVSNSWEDMYGSMANETIYRYQSIFEHPADIDLWSGGVSEKSLPGSMLGPTFACVIATQLSYIRRGDRFWYELPNQPSTFTPEQLQELRKAKLSRIICDNTDLIDTTQIYPMVLPDHEINPRVPCKSGVIPSIDLTKWADYGSDYAPHQYNLLNEIPNTVEFVKNHLRRKRSAEKSAEDYEEIVELPSEEDDGDPTTEDDREQPFKDNRKSPSKDDQNAEGARVYEYYESSSSKTIKPKIRNGMSETLYRAKVKTKNIAQTVPRLRGRLNTRPIIKRPEKENDEIEDLKNDQYFYHQLEKNKFTTESSEEVEKVHPIRPNVNREVVFYHGNNGEKSSKQKHNANFKDDEYDDYEDYGDVDSENDDVEMYGNYRDEPSPLRGGQLGSLNRPNYRKDCNDSNQRHKCRFGVLNIRPPPPGPARPIAISTKHKQSERITVMKRLQTPDELHAEIDKIIAKKTKNYDKRGHDKSHWELRIVPNRYEDYIDSV